MSNELVPRQVSDQIELAKALAASGLLPQAYRQQPANLLYAIQYAQAVGVHPMTAVTGIHVIEGKPTASAQLIGGLVRRAGHKMRVTFDRKTMTAVAQIVRADDPGFTFESVWTLDRAKSANLTGKSVWKSYPDAMLKARAITEVARDACPEALFGIIYTAEELGVERVDEDGAPIVHDVPRTAVVETPAAIIEGEVVEAEVAPVVSQTAQHLAAVQALETRLDDAEQVGIDSTDIREKLYAFYSVDDLMALDADAIRGAIARLDQLIAAQGENPVARAASVMRAGVDGE